MFDATPYNEYVLLLTNLSSNRKSHAPYYTPYIIYVQNILHHVYLQTIIHLLELKHFIYQSKLL